MGGALIRLLRLSSSQGLLTPHPAFGFIARWKNVLRHPLIQMRVVCKTVLDDLREGYTIALVNIKPLKEKDLIELKRAINKIKKTCDMTLCVLT